MTTHLIDEAGLITLTQALVQLETLSGAEGPAIQRVRRAFEALGFTEIHEDELGNITGAIQGDLPGPTLLYDAHVDTVGIAPGVPWSYDPFGGEIEFGRMYGRGTSDMKGALAAAIYAGVALDRSTLAGQVVICASVMEEVLEGVALQAVMDRIRPDFVVIGESTDLNLAIGGRGRAEIHVEAVGRPSHSSSPHLGINAVELMMDAARAIAAIPLGADPMLGDAIIALTDIHSEPYPANSVIASQCRVTYDRRLLAGETVENVLGPIQAAATSAEGEGRITAVVGTGEYTTYTGAALRTHKFFPAWKLDPDAPIVVKSLAGLRAAGLIPELRAYRFCTNAAYSAGIAGVPTIGFGPSPESRAHVVDEYITLDDLLAAAAGYAGIFQAVLS